MSGGDPAGNANGYHGYQVSSEGMAAIVAQLHESGDALDGHASTAPDPPAAGGSTGLVVEALAAVFRSAGSLSSGLAAAAEEVHRNQVTYERADDAVAGVAGAVEEA